MGTEPVPDVAAVTRFVREVIGCNCPDEVFRIIEVQRGSSAVKSCVADCELRIGGRLLIVVTAEPVERLCSVLQNIFSEGRQARNAGRFNRFRLVVQTEGTTDPLLRAFDAVSGRDERMHLHVLRKGEIPNLFLPCA